MNNGDLSKIVQKCKTRLNLKHGKLGDEYYYHSLPLCVVDAVFSISVTYTATSNTVNRLCRHLNIEKICKVRPPATSNQLSISKFLELYKKYTVDQMAESIYQNLQRTSSRSGILKSDAVLRFSRVLVEAGVEYFQDVENVMGKVSFENSIKRIPGQGSGLSLDYFYMLAGSDDRIKADRHIRSFIQYAIGYEPSIEDSQKLITGACEMLMKEHSQLNPRLLDYLIWGYQKDQKKF